MIDHRIIFCGIAALVCFALVPIADTTHRPVAVMTGATYVVLALLVSLDQWSRRNSD